MKDLIKEVATRRFLEAAYRKMGYSDSKNPHYLENPHRGVSPHEVEKNRKADTFGSFIKVTNLPVMANVNYTFECETDGKASDGGYYPKNSFYRLGIVLSGRQPSTVEGKDGEWTFANATLHFDQDMNFIKYQQHTSMGMPVMEIADIEEIGYKK